MELTHSFILPSIHPLLPTTLCLILGIATNYFIPLPVYSPAFLLLPFFIGIIGWRLPRPWLIIALSSAAWLTGILLLAQHYYAFNQFHNCYSGNVSLRATLCSNEPVDHPQFRYQAVINVQEIKPQNALHWDTCNAQLIIYTRKPLDALLDDTVEISHATIKRPNHSFAHYLIKQGCVATHCTDQLILTTISHKAWSIARWISNLRQNVLRKIKHSLSPTTFGLVSSIFLGNRFYVKKSLNKTKDQFKIWGISHYLARSGLHVVLFIMAWQIILSLLPIAYRFKQGLLIFLILLYALLSWSSVSFERALIMFLLYKGISLWGYPSHYIHIITLATLIVLILNPCQLFFLDFQLSFGFTFALAWFGLIEAEKRRLLSKNT